MRFFGRRRYLASLESELTRVRSSGTGRFVLVRGRRRVGKSRLVEEFVKRHRLRAVVYQATAADPEHELEDFLRHVESSNLPAAETVSGTRFTNWDAALRAAAAGSQKDRPSVIVVDELPFILDSSKGVEGHIQRAWDRSLSREPVLLIAIGSDVATMAALTDHRRPLFKRPTLELVIQPFSPREVAEITGLDAAAAFDAYLTVGGMPLAVSSWKRATGWYPFIQESLTDPTAALIVDGERSLAGEFPSSTEAGKVLRAVGSGETAYSRISSRSGIESGALHRSLKLLEDKGVVVRDRPLSTGNPTPSRYHVSDAYLRFYLRFVEPHRDDIERGRGELVAEAARSSWPQYRGQAVEPLIRQSIARLLPCKIFGRAKYVGSWWNRAGVQVDLVGADRSPKALSIAFTGSIKWRQRARFGRADLQQLVRDSANVPGVTEKTLLVGVSRSGFQKDAGLDARLGPEELLAAFS